MSVGHLIATIVAVSLLAAPAALAASPAAAGCSVPPIPSWTLTPEDLGALNDLNMDETLKLFLAVEYPSEGLFLQALTYRAGAAFAHNEAAQARILGRARKDHCPDQERPVAWTAQSAVPMLILSQAPYGFYGFWQKDKDGNAPIDFNVAQRIGWFAAPFFLDGSVSIPSVLKQKDSVVARQVELARRYHAGVDLVLYLSKPEHPETWTSRQDELAQNIADLVGRPLDRFLDRIQPVLLLPPLRSAPTAWDGVTLFLDGYPFENKAALEYLSGLLRAIRKKLDAKEVWPGTSRPSGHHLCLNLVAPYFDLLSDTGHQSTDAGAKLTIQYLSQLVPKDRNEVNIVDGAGAVVDRFLVFLPQPTTATKKQLRQSMEEAISQSNESGVLEKFPNVSVASWRLQMLRRIVCVLSPGTWSWTGAGLPPHEPGTEYAAPGMQFFDDMVYSRNNFGTAGFFPLPFYAATGDAADIASRTRTVFELPSTRPAQSRVAAKLVSAFGIGFATFFGARRRELGLAVEGLILLLALVAVGSLLFFEFQAFCRKHLPWLIAVAALAFVTGSLMLLFDPELSPYATMAVFSVTGLVIVFAAFAQFVARRAERDLP